MKFDRIALAFYFFSLFAPLSAASDKISFPSAKVLKIVRESSEENCRIQTVRFKILSGKFKGKKIVIENYLWDDPAYNTFLKVGMTVILKVRSRGEKIVLAVVKGYKRDFVVIVFFVGFLGLLFLFTGKHFLKVTGSFFLNICGFLFILVPLIKKGVDPVWAVLVFSFFALLITLILITDAREKIISSFVGTFSSVLIAVALAFFVLKAAHITGFYIGGARRLLALVRSSQTNINLFLVAVASIVVAALGMAVDVSVSVSSFLSELASKNPHISGRKIFLAGVSVGSDIFPTMVNSLIFVFVGSSLSLFLSCRICRIGFIRFVNFEAVSFIIFQSILSSGILILTIPLTSIVSAYLLKRRAQ